MFDEYVVKLTRAMQNHASLVGYFFLGLAAGLFIFGTLVFEYPYWSLVEKGFNSFNVESAYTLSQSEPVRIRIPSVGIDARFEAPLGLNADHTIEVPDQYTTVGWYKHGPTPGELGPAVVLGHVDSYAGAAVFYNLKQLEPGRRIFVDREDGTTAEFEVVGLKSVSRTEFPTEEVYGDIDYAGLRLITCTGTYDHGRLQYSHNLIVFARLIEPA